MKKNIFILLAGFLIIGCKKRPEYPFTPEISYKSIITQRNQLNPTTDNIIIAINFKDGDADLGLGVGDTNFPFSRYIDSDKKKLNFDYHNYFIDWYLKQKGKFVLVPSDSILNFNGRFGDLNPKKLAGPIDGVLIDTISRAIYRAPYKGFNDTIKFRVRIQDRKLNKSNFIETDPVILNKR